MDDNMLLNLALDIGEIMISCGAETHRVEDTIERILSVDKSSMPESFVTPTGLFAGVQGGLTGSRTKFKRVAQRSINLEKIKRANSLSREFVEGKITLEEAFREVEKIHKMPEFPYLLIVLSHGIVSACFTLLFNGPVRDGCAAFLIGCTWGLVRNVLIKYNVSDFLVTLFGSILITFLSVLLFVLGLEVNYDNAIIGALMLLVPGVAITNAIRDILGGDYISGSARIVESAITGVAIATGVGIVLRMYTLTGGGI